MVLLHTHRINAPVISWNAHPASTRGSPTSPTQGLGACFSHTPNYCSVALMQMQRTSLYVRNSSLVQDQAVPNKMNNQVNTICFWGLTRNIFPGFKAGCSKGDVVLVARFGSSSPARSVRRVAQGSSAQRGTFEILARRASRQHSAAALSRRLQHQGYL